MTGLFHLRIGAHIHVIPHSKGQIALFLQLTLQERWYILAHLELLCCFHVFARHAASIPTTFALPNIWFARGYMSALIKRSSKLLGLKFVCYDGVIISDIC